MYLAPIINHVLPFFLPNPPNRPESTSPQPGTLTFFPSRAHATHPDSLRLLWADPPPASSSSFSSRIGGNSLVSSPGGFVDQAASDLHNFVCSGRNSEDELSGRCDFSITTVPAQDQGIHLRTRNVTILRSRPRHNSTIHPFTHPTEYLAQRRSRRKEAKFQAAQGIPVTKYELEDDWIWEEEEVVAPDTRDRETLLTLAKMTSNAYTLPESSDWYPLERWNDSIPFGWEKDADGLRGHIFSTPDNSTVIISLKGTSAGLWGSGGPTAKNDKFNDNLLFSCCCGRVDYTWTPVCDCYQGGYKCALTCLEDAVIGESVYSTVGTNLYNNVSYMYPNANIWLVGHSLGGAVASLIGLSFGAPVVTFETPGDRMAAQRIHLPLPPGMPANLSGVTHVYHNADPIAMGSCTGAYSVCYAGGYALEARCHTGESIIYDTVGKLNWAVDARTHRIGTLVNQVLNEDWEEPPPDSEIEQSEQSSFSVSAWFRWGWPGGRKKKQPTEDEPEPEPTPPSGERKRNPNAVPKATSEEECTDCFRWEYGDDLPTSPVRHAKIE